MYFDGVGTSAAAYPCGDAIVMGVLANCGGWWSGATGQLAGFAME